MNSNKNWCLIIVNSVKKNLKRFPKNDLERIKEAIDQIELNPFSSDIIKLSSEENIWRRRVGNYRIIFEISPEKRIIWIYEIKRRTSKTY
jgi:mRNA interferase RelE/StbE